MTSTTRQEAAPRDPAAGAPPRPPMHPASGVREMKLRPHELTDAITPAEQLFVLAHFGVPRVDPAEWSLTIDGLTERLSHFSLDALKAHPKRIVEAVHQCAGSPLHPAVPTRRAANLRWGGVDLATLLGKIGIDRRARYIWSYGLDGGSFFDRSCDWYVKDLPLERLAAGDVLLAYELNGAPLAAEHGFPLRLVVPGYYGTNSVKWLWRLRLAEARAEGLFTAILYDDAVDIEKPTVAPPQRRPVWALAPEAIIVAPAPDTVVALGKPVEIWGWAWSFGGITAVEVSVDGGVHYGPAVPEKRRGWSWQRFSSRWTPAATGEVTLSVRAFTDDGVGQPSAGARNAIHTVRIMIR